MKTILITGSTDGIGKLAAIKLAKDGHEIYLHGRSVEKLEKVVEEIITLTGNEKIKGFVADFSDLDAVKQMVQQVNNDLPKIDVLINNAGIFKSPTPLNKGSFDIRFVVNYFAPYLLTNRLISLLEKGTNPQIINLSSAAQAQILYEALSGKSQISEQDAYAQSKLAITMWSFYLAKTYKNIAIVAVNPGSLLNTNMVKEAYGKYWSSADKGADILYDLAVSENHKGVTGKYFDNDKGAYGEAHIDVYNEKKIDMLISKTNEILMIEE